MMQLCSNFWKKTPALYYALSLLIGSSAALCHSFFLFLFLCSFIFFRKERLIALSFALFGYFYTLALLPPLLSPQQTLQGKGLFRITSISPCSSFQKRLLYRGEFLEFTTYDHQHFSHLPAFIFLSHPKEEKRPKADHLYYLSGEITSFSPYSFFFKPTKKSSWEQKTSNFSLVEMRYKIKKKISQFLEEKIPHNPSFCFLNGLIVGDLDDRYLKFSFTRLGLQHVMAISGSHFAFLIFLLSFIFHRFVTKKKTLFFLLFFVHLYFLFIGPSPSIQRAYLMSQVVLLAQMFAKRSTPLNALGVSLFFSILLDPLIVQNIGFQLSFLCTGALLLGTPLFLDLFSFIFKKREGPFPWWKKFAYHLSFLVKEALSLSCAINLWIVPLLFYDFHKFPLLSLLYNLFFPILSFVPIILLLFSLLIQILLPIAAPLFYALTTFVTKAIVDLILYPPTSLELVLYVGNFPFWLLPIYWSSILLAFIYWKERKKIRQEFLPYL